MFYHAFEKTKKINLGDIPYFPIRGKAADNVRQGKFSEAGFSNILAELPKYLHPLVKFLHLTGMRSGQAQAITWEMIDDDNVLRIARILDEERATLLLGTDEQERRALRGDRVHGQHENPTAR